MTISNGQQCVNVNDLIDSVKILVICPICSESKKLEFPKSICESTDNLTTISIPKGLICNHTFQAFVDKNFKIRGYQKVDYEFKRDSEKSSIAHPKRKLKSDKELFENLIAEGNYLEYNPKRRKEKKSQKNRGSPVNRIPEKPNSKTSSQVKNPPNSQQKDRKSKTQKLDSENSQKTGDISREKTLKEIYEEFWEFIDNDNEVFQKFIVLDERRNRDLFDNLLSHAKP
jgi:hypothetical protein